MSMTFIFSFTLYTGNIIINPSITIASTHLISYYYYSMMYPPSAKLEPFFYWGGYNAKDYRLVERFDPRVGIWERVPNMEQSRSYGATAVADGKIFCFGGRQKDKKVKKNVCTRFYKNNSY